MISSMNDKEKIAAAFDVLEKEAHTKPPLWLQSVRREALSRFTQLGFPTLHDEEWKYTSVEPIVKNSFRFCFEPSSDDLALQKIQPFLFGELGGKRLVFVNGLYSHPLSSSRSDDGVEIGSLREASLLQLDLLAPYFAERTLEKNVFTLLNTAFLHDGAFIFVPQGKEVREPIHLLFISISRGEKIISQPRNLIIASKGSRVSVVESFLSLTEEGYFTNAVTEIFLNEGAQLDSYRIQRESEKAFSVSTAQVSQAEESRFFSYSFSFGAQLARSDLNVILKGEGSACELNGLYLAAGRQHTDHHTVIDHTRPRGTSRQIYKGILKDQARAVFNGKIFVREDAQHTDAHQTNKNLLLSERATVDTKPQLEIFADEVKCTHGAAVGELDEAAVFYVKSRGLSEEEARNLLTQGFASEVVQKVPIEPVRLELDQLVWQRLQKGREAERGTSG